MNSTEAMTIIASINAFWPKAQIEGETAKLWALEIFDLPFEPTMSAVRRLARSQKWPPALAELLEIASPPEPRPDAGPLFRRMMFALNLNDRDRVEHCSPLIFATLDRIGGWSALIGRDPTDPKGFHLREFRVEMNAVLDMVDSGQLELPEWSPMERPALRAVPDEPPSMDPEALDRNMAMLKAAMARLGAGPVEPEEGE